MNSLTRRRLAGASALLLLTSLIPLFALPAAAADPIDGAVTNNFQTWDPSTNEWVPGNAEGYTEGDVAAFSVEITVSNTTSSTAYFLTACFEYLEDGKYGFVDLQPYNQSHEPSLRGGSIVDSLDGASTDWGTIDGVSLLSKSVAASKCATDSIGYTISFTTGSASAPGLSFYIYFGNRLAAAGDTTDYDDVVPSGGGVGSWPVGVFQAWLEDVTGQKTVNFKPGDILPAPEPSLSIVKTADPLTYNLVGDVISYSFLVTNTGNVSLAGPVTVTDDKATDEDCPAVTTVGNKDEFLDPTESITCTASYTITQADLNFGSVTNVAFASADGTSSPTDTETVTAIAGPALSIVKTADPLTYNLVGDVISYSFLVTNTGSVSLAGPVTVTDDKATDEDCPAVTTVGNKDEFLDPDESITCTASYTITQADLNFGSVTNVAFASADGTSSPTDTETVTAPQPELATVGDLVWNDLNGDGIQDLSEPGIAGVTIELINSGGTVVATTVTGANGNYLFTNVPAGTYTIRFQLPDIDSEALEQFTLVGAGGALVDSDAGVGGVTAPFTVSGGTVNLTIDAGVLVVKVAGTTIVATTVAVSPVTLPFTGSESGSALALGMALAGLGGLVLAAVKREDEEEVRANL